MGAKKAALVFTMLGSFIDICITYAIVGVIDQNNMVDAMADLYAERCYTDISDRDIFELQSQFETVLVLDAVEGTLDILSMALVIVGFTSLRDSTWRPLTEGAHAFMFAVFDILIVTINVAVFVLPSYATFTEFYADPDLLCFEQVLIATTPPTPMPTFEPTVSEFASTALIESINETAVFIFANVTDSVDTDDLSNGYFDGFFADDDFTAVEIVVIAILSCCGFWCFSVCCITCVAIIVSAIGQHFDL